MRRNAHWTRSIAPLIVVLLLVGAGSGPALGTHENDKPTETQYSLRADLGDEVFGEENVHYPGGDNDSIILYITGQDHDIEEPFYVDTLVSYSGTDTTGCEVTDIAAGGIDRDNDDRYTETDVSLIGAYKESRNKTSRSSDLSPEDDPGPIAPEGHDFRIKSWIKFWQEDEFGGEPTQFNPDDEGIIALRDCIAGATEPGWYRGWGMVNGTTVEGGEHVRYTTYTNWNYNCRCDSYDEALDTIGPPPATGYTVERGSVGNGSAGADTPDGTATSTATDQGPTPTATTTDGDAMATPSTVEAVETTDGGDTGAPGATATTTESVTAESTETPTSGGGPGFGVVAALLALGAGALLARRR